MNTNAYYHEFSVGFNWWFIVAPMMFIGCILFATRLHRLGVSDGRLVVKKGYKQVAQLFVAVPCTIITFIMMTVESYNGVVQKIDNALTANDSPMWSILIAPFVLGIAAAIAFCLYYYAAFELGRAVKFLKYWNIIRKWEMREKAIPIPDQALVELERRRNRERY